MRCIAAILKIHCYTNATKMKYAFQNVHLIIVSIVYIHTNTEHAPLTDAQADSEEDG